MAPETILVIDHALFRSGLVSMLSTAFGLEIIDNASMEDALASVAPVPTIVLLDIQLPGVSGLYGMSSIYQRWPSARIVVVSALDRPETVDAVMARGAVALLCDVARSCDEPLVLFQTICLGVPGDRSTIVGVEYGTLSFLAEMVSRAVPSRTDG